MDQYARVRRFVPPAVKDKRRVCKLGLVACFLLAKLRVLVLPRFEQVIKFLYPARLAALCSDSFYQLCLLQIIFDLHYFQKKLVTELAFSVNSVNHCLP